MKVMKRGDSLLQSIDKAITMVQYWKQNVTNQGEAKGSVLKSKRVKKNKKVEKTKKELYLFKLEKIFFKSLSKYKMS